MKDLYILTKIHENIKRKLQHIFSFYKGLRFRTKVITILTVDTVLLIIFGILGLNMSTYIYEEQLYNQTAKVVNLISKNVDNKLRQVSKLSFNIMSDSEMQSALERINQEDTSYNRYVIVQKMREKLLKYAFTENYIKYIGIVNLKGTQYTEGIDRRDDSEQRLKQIIAIADMGKGSNLWIEPENKGGDILAVRSIRKVGGIDLSPLGTEIISLDQNKLFEKDSDVFPDDKYYFSVASQNTIIAEQKNGVELQDFNMAVRGREGHFIKNIDGKKYLIVYRISDYTGWKYIIALPSENILTKITNMHIFLILLYFCLFVVITSIGINLLEGVTRPLENLTNRVELMEDELFEHIEEYISKDPKALKKRNKKDEVGRLEKRFECMADKIHSLVRENYEKKLMLKEWQLKTLQGQINPHFLYNTLDSINWLAKANNQQEISVMVKSLGDLLRSSISKSGYIITIGEEIKILNSYINIQSIRFQDRLIIDINIDESLWDCKIPSLTFQPIVENSINYGLEVMVDVCRISIAAIKDGEDMKIIIKDNGPGVDEETLEKLNRMVVEPRRSGIGLKNIDERIKIIFGSQYGLSFESELGQGFAAIIHIPCTKEVKKDV